MTTDNPDSTRPELLKILCILTFIGGGLSLFSNIIMFLSIDIVKEYYENGMFDFLAKDMDINVLEMMIYTKPIFFIFQAMAQALAIFGVYSMWKLKKIGFHIYAIAQITLLIIPQIFLPSLPFPTFELIISLVFVILYAKNLYAMK